MKFAFPIVPRAVPSTRVLVVLAAFALLDGCAEQRIRDQSQTDLASGRADQAVQDLEAGLRAHPDSLTLRTGLLQARGQAVAQAVSDAGTLRASGKLDEAQARLERTLAIDPTNDRLLAQLSALSIERRQRDALTQAQDLVKRGLLDPALRSIAQALQDNPHHPGLLALQRQLESTQRQELLASSQAVLGETRPISLDFRDANLRSVLDVVSRSSRGDYNLFAAWCNYFSCVEFPPSNIQS